MPTTVNDRSLNANDISVYTSLQTEKGAVNANPVFSQARRLSGKPKRTIAYTQSGEIKNNQQGKQQIQDTKTYPTELSTEISQPTKDFLIAAGHCETEDNSITDVDIAATATGFTVPGHTFAVGDFVFVSGLAETNDNHGYYITSIAGDDLETNPAPIATEAAGNSITVASIKSPNGLDKYYFTIQERMVDLSAAANDTSYRTYLDSQINSMTFEVPETGICTSTVSFVSELPVNGDIAVAGQTDAPNDTSDAVSSQNNVAGFWVDGVNSNCNVKSMTLEINNNLQEDRSAGCSRVGYDGRSFEATGSLVTKALISDSREWERKYEDGDDFSFAVELYWPDGKRMIVSIEQAVITEHDMETEANAIASNTMSYAAEESLTSGKTITVYANF